MTGYGFVAGEREILYETRGSSVISMHSMLLSSFMGVGIFGPLLLTLYFVSTGILCFFSRVPPHWKFAFLSTICMIFIISMTSPGLGGRVYGAWLPSAIAMTTITVLCRNNAQIPTNSALDMQAKSRPRPDQRRKLYVQDWTV